MLEKYMGSTILRQNEYEKSGVFCSNQSLLPFRYSCLMSYTTERGSYIMCNISIQLQDYRIVGIPQIKAQRQTGCDVRSSTYRSIETPKAAYALLDKLMSYMTAE